MKISHQTLNVLLDCYSYADQNSEVPTIEYIRDNPQNYTILAPLAQGSYGDVFVVQSKTTKKMLALKRLSKDKIKNHPNTALFTAERNCMIDCKAAKWLISIHTTFQTPSHIFFLMDFYPGGDFLSLLSKLDTLSDGYIKFYATELILAVKELHGLGYIHRDIKPDNILITQDGHIRLGDFGSCVKTINGKVKSNVSVGTPDYISPEVLSSVNAVAEYSYEVDVWSLGVVIYEMVNGQTPFYSTSLIETYKKINLVDYKNEEGSVSVKDVIAAMVCRKEERKTLDEIMKMDFFKGVNFGNEMVPPYIPGNDWSINFQDSGFIDDERQYKNADFGKFIGFTYDENVSLLNEDVEEVNGMKNNRDFKPAEIEIIAEIQITPKIDDTLLTIENNMRRGKIKISKMYIKECMHRMQTYIESISSQHELISYYVDHLSLQNNILKREIRKKESKVEYDTAKYVDELKKELRQKKMETRELEKRIDEEVLSRINLQDEVKYLKTQISNLQLKTVQVIKEFQCRRIILNNIKSNKDEITYKKTTVYISNNLITMDEYEEKINNVFVDDCNNNEMHFLGEKKRALAVKLIFMLPKDNQSMTSVKAEEDILIEISNEEKIIEAIDTILLKSKDNVRAEAMKQKAGSLKRIDELMSELKMYKSGTIVSVDKTTEVSKIKEFKNHKFLSKTFKSEDICYHCKQLLYGTVDQGFQCIDCHMVTHKICYILIKESCELHKSIQCGRLNYVLMNTIEEKSKMLNMFNHL